MGTEKLEKLKLEHGWTGLTPEKKAILKKYMGSITSNIDLNKVREWWENEGKNMSNNTILINELENELANINKTIDNNLTDQSNDSSKIKESLITLIEYLNNKNKINDTSSYIIESIFSVDDNKKFTLMSDIRVIIQDAMKKNNLTKEDIDQWYQDYKDGKW
jgi:hypothetical protein